MLALTVNDPHRPDRMRQAAIRAIRLFMIRSPVLAGVLGSQLLGEKAGNKVLARPQTLRPIPAVSKPMLGCRWARLSDDDYPNPRAILQADLSTSVDMLIGSWAGSWAHAIRDVKKTTVTLNAYPRTVGDCPNFVAGTIRRAGWSGSKMGLSPSPRRFSDRHLTRDSCP